MATKSNKKKINKVSLLFNRFSTVVIRFTGSSMAFVIAFCVILIWGLLGSVFDYSDT